MAGRPESPLKNSDYVLRLKWAKRTQPVAHQAAGIDRRAIMEDGRNAGRRSPSGCGRSSRRLNRADPATTGKRLTTLPRGTEVEVFERVGSWYRVARRGQPIGFIYAPLLAPVKP